MTDMDSIDDTLVVSVLARTARYTIVAFPQGTALCCLDCLRQRKVAMSWNPNDVENRYCGSCHRFLDDAHVGEG